MTRTTFLSAALVFAAGIIAAPWKLNVTLDKRQTLNPGQDRSNGASFADPSLWQDPTTKAMTYAATTNGQVRIQKATSSEFSDSEYTIAGTEFLSQPGTWATEGNFWAPDIGQLTEYDGSYYMYYAAQTSSGHHCLGLARSSNTTGIGGPYTDGSTSSWICPTSQGGAIDPSGFYDVGYKHRYFAYKIDGNSIAGGCGKVASTPIYLQQTESDGYTLIDKSIKIWGNEGAEDAWNVEAPSLCRDSGGTYYLFFSSNCYTSCNYKTNYVSSTKGPKGPYGNRKVLLQNGNYGLCGPGGADVSPDCKRMVFHAYDDGAGSTRSIYASYISASGGTVRLS